jgi:hypothetical protein
MTVNPLGEGWVHNCLRSGTNSNRLGQVRLTTLSDPCDFGTETFDVVLFFVQGGLSNKHREVAVLNAEFLYSAVKEFRNLLPDEESGWSKDITTRNFVVLNHI